MPTLNSEEDALTFWSIWKYFWSLDDLYQNTYFSEEYKEYIRATMMSLQVPDDLPNLVGYEEIYKVDRRKIEELIREISRNKTKYSTLCIYILYK